jgi:hypothetical protein
VASITHDVVGLSDDAIRGYRLVIHATQDTVDGSFTFHSAERAYVCWRGVTDLGLCI